jgi:hypothetical protein
LQVAEVLPVFSPAYATEYVAIGASLAERYAYLYL